MSGRGRALARDERGAIMLIGLFMGVFLTGLMFMMTGIADAAAHRERLQDASDAGATAAAAVYARSLNLMVQYDHVLEQALAADAAIEFVIEARSPTCWDLELERPKPDCLAAQRRARDLAEDAAWSIRQTARRAHPLARDAVDRTSELIDGRHAHGGDRLRVFLLTAPNLLDAVRADVDVSRIADEAADWLQDHRDSWHFELSMPLAGFSVADLSSGFGMRRHPTLGIYRMHEGVDFGAPEGTPIRAPANGTILSRSYSSCGGNILTIAHGPGLSTRYMHLSRYADDMFPGRRVHEGEVVAFVGNTGTCTTGAHLHFEVLVRGTQVDPLEYLGDGTPVAVTDEGVEAAVRRVRTSWRSRIEHFDFDLDVRDRQVRAAAVRGLESLGTSQAGVSFGAFGASGGGLDGLRDMGRVAWAQAEFGGSTNEPTWDFRLARFVPDDDTRGAGSACAAAGGGDACAGIDGVISRLGGASTK